MEVAEYATRFHDFATSHVYCNISSATTHTHEDNLRLVRGTHTQFITQGSETQGPKLETASPLQLQRTQIFYEGVTLLN